MERPILYVLAGVNGAGKSSVGGHILTQAGMAWFNPDTFARELVQRLGRSQEQANAEAWAEGVRRLDAAVAAGGSFAFETTLGGQTIVEKLIAAASTHDVLVWYCGLRDAEHHIARVQARVARGGHDIPEERIRERCKTSCRNLLKLMPHLVSLRVYDNSVDVEPGEAVPEPALVLYVDEGQVHYPTSLAQMRDTPDWAKPLVEASLSASEQCSLRPV